MMQLFGMPIDLPKYNESTCISGGLQGRQYILPAIYCCTAPAPCLGNKERVKKCRGHLLINV